MSTSDPLLSHQQALALLSELRARLALVEQSLAPRPPPLSLEGEIRVLGMEVQGLNAAVLASSVEEVVPYAWLTEIPEAPPWVAGLLDLGGRMVCVLDVAARISGASHHPRVRDVIVVCRVKQRRIGLCVNAVNPVVAYSAEVLGPPPIDVPYAPYLLGTLGGEGPPLLVFSVELLLSTSAVPPVPEVLP
jgi:chemotaxis signal transduction protein